MSESEGAHEGQKEVNVNFHISVEICDKFSVLSPERAPGKMCKLAASLEGSGPMKAQRQVLPGAWAHLAEHHGLLTPALTSALSKAQRHSLETLEPSGSCWDAEPRPPALATEAPRGRRTQGARPLRLHQAALPRRPCSSRGQPFLRWAVNGLLGWTRRH